MHVKKTKAMAIRKKHAAQEMQLKFQNKTMEHSEFV